MEEKELSALTTQGSTVPKETRDLPMATLLSSWAYNTELSNTEHQL